MIRFITIQPCDICSQQIIPFSYLFNMNNLKYDLFGKKFILEKNLTKSILTTRQTCAYKRIKYLMLVKMGVLHN